MDAYAEGWTVTRYQLPDIADMIRLGDRHEWAITVYAETSPAPDERENSLLQAKSAVDRALRTIREGGARHATEEKLRSRWAEIADSELWLGLSRSLAIFIADDFHEVYVLPNALEAQSQVGNYFDIGQLMRAVTTPQEAYALTLSANGWNLWRATATTRAEELPLVGEYATDVADATNRTTVRDRGHVRRLVGAEGKKVLLETYAKRVAEAVQAELGQADSSASPPLFLFATDPLLDLYRGIDHRRQIVAVPGAPDELRPDQIDRAIRESLPRLNAARTNERVDEIGNGVGRGLVATDVVDIARAAVSGAVSTLVYNFVVDTLGRLDDTTGEISYGDDGYDLLSRIAVIVLDKDGEVIAARPEEITAGIWNGTALAALRFPLS
jgi:Bacterial archaeo-eukaryotic release factor family 11